MWQEQSRSRLSRLLLKASSKKKPVGEVNGRPRIDENIEEVKQKIMSDREGYRRQRRNSNPMKKYAKLQENRRRLLRPTSP